MPTGMKSQKFQYANYTPAEFEQFRNAVQMDGFTVTQNTLDTVSGHIGSLTYLTGSYNRNQQVLTVEVKTSPWQSFPDSDLKSNVNRVVARDVKDTGVTVNPIPVKTPPAQTVQPLGTNKNIVQPAIPLKVAQLTQTPPKPVEAAKPAVTPAPAQTPVPAQTPKPVIPTTGTASTEPEKAATTTPTK